MLDRHRDHCGAGFQPCSFGGIPDMWNTQPDDQRAQERVAGAQWQSHGEGSSLPDDGGGGDGSTVGRDQLLGDEEAKTESVYRCRV